MPIILEDSPSLPEVLRVVTLSAGGRPVEVFNLDDSDGYRRDRGSFEFVLAESRPLLAESSERYGGAMIVGETHGNAEVHWTAQLRGSTRDQAVQRLELMLSEIRKASRGRLLEYRPPGVAAHKSSFMRIAGPGRIAWDYAQADTEFVNGILLKAPIAFPVMPLVEWAPMTVRDDFAVDSIADYTFDIGGGTISVSGGQLVPSTTASKYFYHSARGYTYTDAQITLKYTTGASVAGSNAGLRLRRLDANNYLWFDAVSGTGMRILKRDVSVDTALATSASVTLSANTTYWIRARTEGNVLTVEHWTTEPTPMGTPAQTVSHTLTGADATKFGAAVSGQAGLRLDPPGTDWRYDDFAVEPYTRRSLTLPDTMPLLDIPGNAPALADVEITHSGGSNTPAFALIGWTAQPLPHNIVWNGDFEDDANGWSVAAVTNLHAAATSITRVTTAAKYGTASGEVVCPATNDSGASFRIYRRFKKGVTYTAKAWVRSAAQTTALRASLGNAASSDVTDGTDSALSSTWAERSVTWTPTADRADAHIALTITAATATTFQVDGVRVYEGATEPTLHSQTEGRGAVPPFGIIEGEACDTGVLTGWAITSDAGSRSGFKLSGTASDFSGYWPIDPALLVADDFSEAIIDIEVWAVLACPASVQLTVSAALAWESSGNSEKRATVEPDTVFTVAADPGAGRFPVRLGVLTCPVDRDRPRPYYLHCRVLPASSTTVGLDYFWLNPVAKRATAPFGHSDATSVFRSPALGEQTVTIHSDLHGSIALRASSIAAASKYPAFHHGLGGAPIELPPGDDELLLKLSNSRPNVFEELEQLSHTATASVHVTPRSYALRDA